jgi:hydrogenase maturation protease
LTAQASPPAATRIVVAGLGSEYRSDDGAGPAIAARVAQLAEGVTDVGPITDPLDLLGLWDGADLAIVADVVRSGAEPGAIWLIDLDQGASPPSDGTHGLATSSHGIGLAGVLRLARAIGQAPGRVVVVGIEGIEFAQGIGLSPAVAAAIESAARRTAELIEEARRAP